MNATIFHPDGSTERVESKGRAFSLKELQSYVGGFIELLYARDGKWILVLNEEGHLKDLPLNASAMAWAAEHTGVAQVLVGPALLVPKEGIK